VSYYCRQLALRLGMTREQIDTVQTAAILHDIGKIGVPDAVLQKPGPLTAAEFAIVRTHPERAVPILGHASFLSNEIPIILHHHERYDGRGYPRGLRGSDIPILARVLSIADAIDTILSARAYKPSCDLSHVKQELIRGSGTQFDPDLAAAAVAWLTECPGDIVVQPVEVAVS
jgi:HD-GYP domain-containing protein (c-di-GMP phosphodiesterase class II)